jgi:ATP-dependent DNA helicase RecG
MIASTFFRAGIIESWGRGISDINDACKTAGKREPTIEFKRGREFSVTFYGDTDIVENVVENVVENIVVNQTQVKILEFMRKNPKTTAKVLAKEIGIAPRNVQVQISALKSMGMIERVGAAKGGHWVVK